MMRRILMVDDEVSLRTSLTRYVGRQGYQVVQTGSEEEAIQALRREKIECARCSTSVWDLSGIDHIRVLVSTTLGAKEFEAMAAVAEQRQALVFIEDEAKPAYPAGITGETLGS